MLASGCGGYAARRITQAPNRYPSWLAPQASVFLYWENVAATNIPSKYLEVGPPEARLRYRVMPAADYELELESTNRTEQGKERLDLRFKCSIPGKTNSFTQSPRGTVVLLHGYGLGEFAMFPWALRLAEDGWRCVLVDLRGHGKSTGKQISYGLHETSDLSQLLDEIDSEGQLAPPVSVVGVSYGAALALRWKATDPRVGQTVAIAPYAVLSNAVINICREYAPLMPLWFPRAGLKHVPELLGVEPGELDPLTVVTRKPVQCLLVSPMNDKVTSPEDTQALYKALAPGSRLSMVWKSSHESVAYHFNALTPVVEDWLMETPASD